MHAHPRTWRLWQTDAAPAAAPGPRGRAVHLDNGLRWLAPAGLDSLGVARLSARLATQFGVSLSPRELFLLPTLGELEATLFGGAAALRRALLRAPVVDWAHEVSEAQREYREGVAQLREELRQAGAAADFAAPPNGAARDVVLLTGATGFLGAFLLAQLARAPQPLLCGRQIVCLVRAKDDGAALVRLEQRLRFYGLWDEALRLGDRLRAVAADLAQPRLGLSPHAYCALAARVCAVVHNAALVSYALPYVAMREPNVGGTRRVLELATLFADAGTSVDMAYVSTLGFVPAGTPPAPCPRPPFSSTSSLSPSPCLSSTPRSLPEKVRLMSTCAHVRRPGRAGGASWREWLVAEGRVRTEQVGG